MNIKKKFYKNEVQKILDKEISKLINKSGPVVDINYQIPKNSTIISKLLNSEFAQKFINKNQITKISSNTKPYSNFILMLLYLYLFNELFVTGRFDSEFNKRDLNISLNEFFK